MKPHSAEMALMGRSISKVSSNVSLFVPGSKGCIILSFFFSAEQLSPCNKKSHTSIFRKRIRLTPFPWKCQRMVALECLLLLSQRPLLSAPFNNVTLFPFRKQRLFQAELTDVEVLFVWIVVRSLVAKKIGIHGYKLLQISTRIQIFCWDVIWWHEEE